MPEEVIETFYPGVPCFVAWILLLSTFIAFVIVAVPIIVFDRRKVS